MVQKMYQSSRFDDKKDAFSGNIKYFSPHFSYTCTHGCNGIYGRYTPGHMLQ